MMMANGNFRGMRNLNKRKKEEASGVGAEEEHDETTAWLEKSADMLQHTYEQ